MPRDTRPIRAVAVHPHPADVTEADRESVRRCFLRLEAVAEAAREKAEAEQAGAQPDDVAATSQPEETTP